MMKESLSHNYMNLSSVNRKKPPWQRMVESNGGSIPYLVEEEGLWRWQEILPSCASMSLGLHKKFQRRCQDLKLDVHSPLLPFWQFWIQATNLRGTVGQGWASLNLIFCELWFFNPFCFSPASSSRMNKKKKRKQQLLWMWWLVIPN